MSANCPTLSRNPYFHEYDNKIIDLSLAKLFRVDHMPPGYLMNAAAILPFGAKHIPLGSYWATAVIGMHSYQISPPMESEEKVMVFLRDLTEKIQKVAREKNIIVDRPNG